MWLSAQLLDATARLDEARSAREAGERMFDALRPFGARGFFAGSFPATPSASLGELVAGHQVLARRTPAGWLDAYADRTLDEGNPVILAPGLTPRPFRWSEGGLPHLKGWKGLALAREIGIADGFAVPCIDLPGRVGVVSIGFERFTFDPGELRLFQFLAMVAYERMRALAPQPPRRSGALTPKERDCLAFVAEGRSDSEIGAALGIAATTAHWHIENAKRKLGARSRAQAVGRLHALGLLEPAGRQEGGEGETR